MRHLRYWLWLAAKLAVATLLVAGFWWFEGLLLPPPPGGLMTNWPRFGSDFSYTLAAALSVIFGFGLGWLCAVDQLYRCRVCLRRLRMPQIEGANYSHLMLQGAPMIEYICTYGHGKLKVPEVHVSISRARRWIGYGSLWEDLMQAEAAARSDSPPAP